MCVLKSSKPGRSLRFYSVRPREDSTPQGLLRVEQVRRPWEPAGRSPKAPQPGRRDEDPRCAQAPQYEYGVVQDLSSKYQMPAKPIFFLFPVCTLPFSPHTHRYTHKQIHTNTHTKCLEPAVGVPSEVSFIKKYTAKGQKVGHCGEQYGGSIKN